MIIGQEPDTVATLSGAAESGTAYGITADLSDRMAAEAVSRQLAAEHADATLLEATLHSFDAFHPLGRTGTVRDVANTVTCLLSPATSWVTGPSGTGRRRHGRTQLAPPVSARGRPA